MLGRSLASSLKINSLHLTKFKLAVDTWMRTPILLLTVCHTDKVHRRSTAERGGVTLEDFFFYHINGRNSAIDSHSVSNQKITGTDSNKSSEIINL